MENNIIENKTKNKKFRNIIIYFIFAILIIYTLLSVFYFNNAFLPNTYINGNEYSYMNKDKAILKLNREIEKYTLVITDNELINEKINANEIELMYDVDEEINNVINNQNSWLWGLSLFNKNEIELSDNIRYNEKYLKDKIDSFDFVINSGDIIGEPAKIIFNNSEYVIEKGKHGNKLDRDALDLSIKNCITKLQEIADLNEISCFEESEYNDKNQTVIAACNKANQYIKAEITINLGEENKAVIINKELINKWLCIDNKYNVFFDRIPIEECVNEYASTFNTYGKTRSFLTAHGIYENVAGGDFGWLINKNKEIDDIVTAIKAGTAITRTPACYYSGLGHGEKDWGNTYIEVDLTNQHMYVWVKGERVLDSDVVTGSPIPSRVTPPGTYSVKAKMKNAILRGDNYRTPVSYWMPFNRGIGFHDATWQSSFGGTRYKRGYGSHGCVNLPLRVAKQLYEYVYVGIPVICYHTSAKGIAPLITTTTTEMTTETTTSAVTTVKTTTKPVIQATTIKTVSQTTTVKPVTQTTTVKSATATTTNSVITQTTTNITTQATTIIEASSEATTNAVQTTTAVNTDIAVPIATEETTQPTTEIIAIKEKEVITT